MQWLMHCEMVRTWPILVQRYWALLLVVLLLRMDEGLGRGGRGGGGGRGGRGFVGRGRGPSAGFNDIGNITSWVITGVFVALIIAVFVVFRCCRFLLKGSSPSKPIVNKRKMDSIMNKHGIFHHKTLTQPWPTASSETQISAYPGTEEMSIFNTGNTLIPMQNGNSTRSSPVQSELIMLQSSYGDSTSEFSECVSSFDPDREILHFSTSESKSSYL